MPIFYATNGAKNFVGKHASGAAATAFVLAQRWDTLGTGLGTVQEGMMYYDTTAHQMYYWDSAAWVNYSGEIEGGVYVDATFGSDASGDGTIGRPYKTLTAACTAQPVPDPLDVTTFTNPLTFFLAPGTYAGPTVMPKRMEVSIVGRNCVVSGSIYWYIDPEMWSTYGLNVKADLPHLRIAAEVAVWGDNDQSEFLLDSGSLVALNGNVGTGNEMPVHVLEISGVRRDAFSILNSSSDVIGPGLSLAVDATNSMQLFLRDSQAAGTCVIAGEADRDTVAVSISSNEVEVHAERSSLVMYGCIAIHQLTECIYETDYRKDHDGNAYTYGRVQGKVRSDYFDGNVFRSQQSKKNGSFMGYDPAAAAPTHIFADAVTFDRVSLVQLASSTTVMATSFYGFDAAPAGDSGYGRGWIPEGCYGASAVLRIPNDGYSFGEWRLFAHAYSMAGNMTTDLGALSVDNQVTIELEGGRYWFEDDLDLDKEFVNVVGFGNAIRTSHLFSPRTEFYLNENALESSATHGSLQNIALVQAAAFGDTKYCLFLKDAAAGFFYKNLTFNETPTTAGTVYAVVLDPALAGVAVASSFEDCWSLVDGFLYGGSLNGSYVRCRGGEYSFGGWNGAAAMDIVVGGTFVDCLASSTSFAASAVGGDMTFSAIAVRCQVSAYGFGHTRGGDGTAWTGLCSGTLTDCDNYLTGGFGSFGYSETGVGEASADFFRCSSGFRSFGCSTSGAALGIFSGLAEDCKGVHQCFGSNPTDPTMATCSGNVILCAALYQSFGARGTFSGNAYKCRATYGSFGWAVAQTAGRMDDCQIENIRVAAGQGPPGVWGALLRNCTITVKTGEDVAPLVLTGGTGVGGDETRVYASDLYSDTHATSIDTEALGFYDVQLAHCRMNVDIDGVHVTNLIAVPYNVVDAAYNPS